MTAVPPKPTSSPTVHLPAQAEPSVAPGRVIPGEAWPVRPGLPSTPSPAAEPVDAPVAPPAPAVATAAGGSGDWWTRRVAAPPMPPGDGGMTPWHPAPAPSPWGGPAGMPAPFGDQPPIAIRIELVQPEPPKVGFWKRLWRLVTFGLSPYAAWGALAAAVIPIPYVGYGLGRIWGSVLFETGTWTHYAVPNVLGLGVLALTLRGLVRRPTATRFFFFAVASIGATTGVLWPDVVAAMTGVRS